MRHRVRAVSAVLLFSSVLLLTQAAQQAEVSQMHAAAAVSAQQAEAADMLAAAQQLIQVLQDDGAEVNADIRQAQSQSGVGMFALRDLKQGDTIMAVPVDRGFSALSQYGVLDFLLEFLLDLYNPDSPRALMYAAMPRPHKLRHQLNFPQQYLPLLQHKDLEELMGEGMHSDLRAFYDLHHEVLAAAGISYDHAVHALGLLGTRTFSQPTADGQASIHYALPLLDLAKHDNTCLHYNIFQPCAFDASRECAYFTAGAEVKLGDEVCSWYGYLLPDRAFLEYGLLPEVPAVAAAAAPRKAKKVKMTAPAAAAEQDKAKPSAAADAPTQQKKKKGMKKAKAAEAQLPALPLFGIDRHDYDPANPLTKLDMEPKPFWGNKTSLAAHLSSVADRIDQLQQLHDTLRSGDAKAAELAAQGPAAGDEDGAFLKQVLEWRLQRQRAVVFEIERLQKFRKDIQVWGALNNKNKKKTQRRR